MTFIRTQGTRVLLLQEEIRTKEQKRKAAMMRMRNNRCDLGNNERSLHSNGFNTDRKTRDKSKEQITETNIPKQKGKSTQKSLR